MLAISVTIILHCFYVIIHYYISFLHSLFSQGLL